MFVSLRAATSKTTFSIEKYSGINQKKMLKLEQVILFTTSALQNESLSNLLTPLSSKQNGGSTYKCIDVDKVLVTYEGHLKDHSTSHLVEGANFSLCMSLNSMHQALLETKSNLEITAQLVTFKIMFNRDPLHKCFVLTRGNKHHIF